MQLLRPFETSLNDSITVMMIRSDSNSIKTHLVFILPDCYSRNRRLWPRDLNEIILNVLIFTSS